MEMEFKTLFSSVGAKSSTAGGDYARSQSKTTSTTIIALGGSHEVASILSDAYSPTFKSAFKDWLVSIPKYPKPFLFQVGSITDLLNFRMRDLFPDEKVNWGCEGHAAGLQTETNANGDKVTFFQTVLDNGTTVKHYCTFDSRKGLEEAIRRRRISLKRAIEVYMEEVCRARGTQQKIIRGASIPRSNPLPFYIRYLREKVQLSYTIYWKIGTPFTYL